MIITYLRNETLKHMPKIGIKYTVGNNFDDVELNGSVICCVERQWI